MRVIGIDPGLTATGYGILDEEKGKVAARSYGVIRPPTDKPLAERLDHLFENISKIIGECRPDILAIEDTFHQKNFKSALLLGQARGVIILAAARLQVPCVEYAPRKVKQSVVGNGNATKEQVQYMVSQILQLKKKPSPLDSSDALAVGLCYLNQNKWV